MPEDWFSTKYSGLTSLPISWKRAVTRQIRGLALISEAARSARLATRML